VIVPVFGHSVFVADALDSALAQQTQREVRFLIVDDGCPHDETRRIATAVAASYPDRVEYIRRTNGGLGRARNTGVNYALVRWPLVRAFYFLDADNMIEPRALDRAYDLAMSDSKIGWVYPDVLRFGAASTYEDCAGRYSILRHLKYNVAEAASLVKREVFDRGCRFDETWRYGYEDWEFWWQCIEAGFVGRHAPFFGVRYRTRPESMLSEADRKRDRVMSYMRDRHKGLFRPKFLLALEAVEAPRYGLLLPFGRVRLCTDVRGVGESIEVAELVHHVIASSQNSVTHRAPRYVVAGSEECLELLRRARLDRFALWWLENQFFVSSGVAIAAIQIVVDPSFVEVSARPIGRAEWPPREHGIHLMMVEPNALTGRLEDSDQTWIYSLLSDDPNPGTAVLRVELPAQTFPNVQCPDVIHGWLEFYGRLRALARSSPRAMPVVKTQWLGPVAAVGRIPSELLECGPLLPLLSEARLDIAFVLPFVSFGGVEKIALNVAAQFQRRGWRCHLLILTGRAIIDDSWLSVFDTIVCYEEEAFHPWAGPQQYLGTNYPGWLTRGDGRSLEGLLLPMDVVVNFHAAILNKVLYRLRKSDIVTAACLQVNDLTPFGRETGHAFLTLGHEHVYDLVGPGSESLCDWCHAMGFPRDKIVLVPNAPSYPVGADEIAEVLARRSEKNRSPRELNVLFLGRFDRQKGIDRLVATVNATKRARGAIAWRVVGSAVVEGVAAEMISELDGLVEPAMHDPADITKLFEWADVLFVPSHWEGLPLTILEAARLGVVPLASSVGAVSEVVQHGITGLLIDVEPIAEYAACATTLLLGLANDRDLLARLSRGAAEAMTRSWEAGCSEFIERIGVMVQASSK
jgi:glycosyltransferase involved in cell wall biosynthesis